MNKKIPCKNCLTLGACKPRYDFFGDEKDFISAFMILRKHCSMIKNWTDNNEETKKEAMVEVYNFYKKFDEKDLK